jgi:head-tail adaptor
LDDEPFFDDASGSVRFWVMVDDRFLGASVSREALRHRYHAGAELARPLETFTAYRPEIEAAARRRFAEGALEPVMLREVHLRPKGPD